MLTLSGTFCAVSGRFHVFMFCLRLANVSLVAHDSVVLCIAQLQLDFVAPWNFYPLMSRH